MNKRYLKQFYLLTTIAFILALVLVPTANAADGTWTGGTSATWATTSNWLNDIVAGSASANADIATFNSATYLFQPAAASNYFLGGLVFGSSSGGTTITTSTGGNRLNIGSSGIQMNSGTGAVILGNSGSQGINITANQTWSNDSSSLLNIGRVSVDDTFSGTYTITIAGSGSGGVTVNNNLSDDNNVASALRRAAVVINSSGTGATSFANGSTYSGGTTLTAGLLQISGTSSGTVGAVTSSSVGTGNLALNGGRISSGSTSNRSILNALSIGGDVAIGDAVNNGTLTFSANSNLGGATRTITLVSSALLDGVVSSGGITKAGAGQLSLTGAGANIYSGTTTVNEGTLFLQKTGGAIAIAGGLTIGDGVGSDVVSLGASDQIADTVVVNMIGTASAQRGNFQLLGFNETIGGLSGGGQVQNTSLTADSVLTLNVANATTQTSSAVLRNSGGTASGHLSIVKTGGGTQILGGNMTYTGVTSINQGTLAVTGSLLSSGTVLVNDGGSLSGSGSVGAVTLASGSFLKPGNSPGTLTAASSIWQAGSTYSWEIDQASGGTAGLNWDLFDVTNALDLSALSSNAKMNLVLNSLESMDDFNPNSAYSWVIAQAGSFIGTGLTNGANVTDLFNITAGTFAGAVLPTTGFKVEVGTDSVSNLRTLSLTTIPEPSTGSMLGFGLGGLVLTRLLRRKQS
jgi:autotransporter-associated beta strand protein